MRRIPLLLCSLLAAAPHGAAAAQPEALGLKLSEATARAQRDSPLVVAATKRLAGAEAMARSARAMAGPQVYTGLFVGVSSAETMTGAPPGADPALSATLGRDYAVAQQVSAMLPLYTGKRLSSEVRRADAEAAAARYELEAVRASVSASVREAYLMALLAYSRLRVAEADRIASHDMAQNARVQWENGKGIEASYLRALARERAADSDVAMAEAERAKAMVQLRTAMALPADLPIELTDPLAAPRTFASLDDAVKAVRAASPDLLAASKRLEAARAAVRAARGAEDPQVYASLMGGWAASRGMGGRSGASVGLAIGYPLFDGGRRREETARARAEAEAAVADAEEVRLEVEAAVRTAWLDMTAAQTARSAAQAASTAASSAYDVIELRVRNQKSILVEQLDALAAVRKAQLDAAQALFEEAMAAVRIERAVGRY